MIINTFCYIIKSNDTCQKGLISIGDGSILLTMNFPFYKVLERSIGGGNLQGDKSYEVGILPFMR